MAKRCSTALIIVLALIINTVSFAQNSRISAPASRVDYNKTKWVDSVYNTLTLEERIGQLFMVAAYSGGKSYNQSAITELINKHQIGGLIFMQGDPVSQANQTNIYQQLAQVPLLIGMDAEWGLGMRLTGVTDFPRSMMLGATRDSMLVYRLGVAVADQCRRLGVHIDFAPVVDVNNNPNNPIINARSYGEDKRLVARLGIAYMNGLQQNGVIACAKHFPGHGDTEVDSHKDLPVINKSLKQLDTLELYPFKRLINAGVKSVMVAHLNVPALENEQNIPTTLSKNTITNVLKGQLGFDGLVFTDALNMSGVTKYFAPGEVDERAFLAGNDVLLFSQDVPLAIQKIKAAINSGAASEGDLEQRVKKILAAKYDVGLNHFCPINTANLVSDLNKYAAPLREAAAEGGVTLVRDNNHLIGKILSGDARVSYIGVNTDQSVLYNQLSNVKPTIAFNWLPKGSSAATLKRLDQSMEETDVTIVAVHNMSFYPSGGDYGLDAQQMSFLKSLESKPNVIYVILGNAYLLNNFCNAGSAIVSYEDDSITETVVSKILLRQMAPKGKLPVTPCPDMKAPPEEEAVEPEPVAAIKSSDLKHVDFPADAGVVNPAALEKLNKFIAESMVKSAVPGCRIVAAKNGKVFYDEAFGYYDYSKAKGVELFTMYDIASMTKVTATTLAVMHLYEQGKLDLNKTLGDYLKWTHGTDKAGLKIHDLLLHQAGLKAWIPFYKSTLTESGDLRPDLYRHEKEKDFRIPVAKDLYLRNDYADSIWYQILQSPLENKGRYVYSDLDFYFLAAVVEQITNKQLNKYVEEQFYKPMGLKRITYNPLTKFKLSDIAPTENDVVFRKQLIHGYVHDQGSAMFGGVAGHAGIFASADDVAAIFQMLLNGGVYKGKRFFREQTIKYFTAYNSTISRRGLGFDKPSADKDDGGPAGNRVSGYAFGHQGFTGTCGWADPATGVVFIFLSNRVNPSAENNNINRLNVRTVAQDYIYEALGIPENRSRETLYKKQTR
jgi:beta-glucosidase-like glycosyl hydrolase/CubicO group peptidase (beta-lactamase class C family)